MNGFRNFMTGRYGTDQLTVAMLVSGMVFTFIGDAFRLETLTLLTYAIFIGCVFRTMSRNIATRRSENQKFMKYFTPVMTWSKSKYNMIRSGRSYKYFKCPNCNQQLRAPRGKGKIAVTCQKCGIKFIQNS